MNNKRRWEILYKRSSKSTEEAVDIFLKNRGIRTEKEKKEFFNPPSPERLGIKALGISQTEVNKAIKRIKKALNSKEKVIVYGDYDADGICGTAIVWETLYSLGLNVLPYIPERFSEGYGLNVESIRKLKTENRDLELIITVDHGIVANKKVDYAKELGIDVIITDHHLKGKLLPSAYCLIHTTKIGGAAIAWILCREIVRKFQINSLLELAAIGTIADQIPLVGPNRSFAKYGLEALNKTKRPGLLALFKEAGIKAGLAPRSSESEVGPYEVGFMIAPRLNAMGRLEHAMESLRLLCTKDKIRAEKLAVHLNRVNSERQRIVDEVVLHALRQVSTPSSTRGAQGKLTQQIIVVSGEYNEGVIGLAAGKLVEEFYRPAIVFSKKEEVSKASARSVSGFNIIEAIRKLEDLYIEGGGHPMAAGFSIQTSKVEEFAKRINEVARPFLTQDILTKRLKIDLEIEFNRLNWELYEEIKQFAPFGLGNPTPVFVTKKVKVTDAKVVGKEGKHLRLKLEKDGIFFDAIFFRFGESFIHLSTGSQIDIAFCLEEDSWNGKRKLQLVVKDLKMSS